MFVATTFSVLNKLCDVAPELLIGVAVDVVVNRGHRSLVGRLFGVEDRYDQLWQDVVDELSAAGLLRREGAVSRLLLMGAVNYTIMWYKPGQGMNLDQIADETVAMFLRGEG